MHPLKVFFKVTFPLIKPALMVAVIFRLLDALRIFDLIYVLTANSKDTMSMSVTPASNWWISRRWATAQRPRPRCS